MKKLSISWVLALLVAGEAIDAAAQFCFKKTALALGDHRISTTADVLAFVLGAMSQPYLWFGMGLVLVVFAGWGIVLSKVDLSVAMPLTSISYLFVAAISAFYLGEHISLLRWCGILLILAGVWIVAQTSENVGNSE